MKVEFPSPDEFIFKPCEVGGEQCVLITPENFGVKWTTQNRIFRSSLWNKNGEPVSLGFKKFWNISEREDITPTPKNLNGCDLISKEDGSCLIISKYRGQLITRTRGTVDASKLDSGFEIELLKQKYPRAFHFEEETANHSRLFEWVSPNQRIVLDYGSEADIFLIGVIFHDDYSLAHQKTLDEFAFQWGVKRPKRFNFDSLEEMTEMLQIAKGIEGICLYLRNGDILKCKTPAYIALHSIKSNLTTDKLAELFFLWEQPTYEEYCNKFSTQFDHEILIWASGAISKLFDGVNDYKRIIDHLKNKVEERKSWTRKDFAITAQSEYGSTKKFGILMNLFLGVPPKTEALKHLLLQNAKQCELGFFRQPKTVEADL